MLDGGMAMPFYGLNCPAPGSKKVSSSGKSLSKSRTPKPLLVQPNTFVVCSDPALGKGISPLASLSTFSTSSSQHGHSDAPIIENLKRKRAFLEHSGARCLITPCHLSHKWLGDTTESCKLPFLHVGDCVAMELKEAKLKPLEAGSSVRIGLLATDKAIVTGFYHERLQNQGFDVVLPDEATMKHIVVPAVEAFNKRDQEGARNLLRIAVHVLLIRAVNMVILASDELLNLLPPDDPILKKCIDPMDALARAAIKWSRSTGNLHEKA